MMSQRDRDIDRNRCSDAWYERSREIDKRLSNNDEQLLQQEINVCKTDMRILIVVSNDRAL